jgi:hypothetical protein
VPDTKDDLIRHCTFSEADLSIVRQRRGSANRLGFAVQLCYLRFPGIILGVDQPPFPSLLKLVANQLKVGVESWEDYGQREQTRREHLVELQTVFGFQPFTMSHYRKAVHTLTELAMQTDKGIVLATALRLRPPSPAAAMVWLQIQFRKKINHASSAKKRSSVG